MGVEYSLKREEKESIYLLEVNCDSNSLQITTVEMGFETFKMYRDNAKDTVLLQII